MEIVVDMLLNHQPIIIVVELVILPQEHFWVQVLQVHYLAEMVEHPVEVGTQVMDETILIVIGVILIEIIMVGLYLVQDLEHFFIVADFAIKIAHL
jgi:hypothetical protein